MPSTQNVGHKAADQVPHGPYCYTILSIEHAEDGMPIMKTRNCDYFERQISGRSRCGLLNVEDDFLLDDGCKICGINEDVGP